MTVVDVRTLLGIASPSIGDAVVEETLADMPSDLVDLLRERNGFVVLESALRFLPLDETPAGIRARTTLPVWSGYGAVPTGAVFFAEDAFANQFFVSDEGYRFLDLETGEVESIGSTLDSFLNMVFAEWNYFSGYELARSWQLANGALGSDERLVPRTPFVLGGGYEVANLRSAYGGEAIRLRSGIHTQLRGRPDGMGVAFDPQTYTIG
jgi:hypothetical protein